MNESLDKFLLRKEEKWREFEGVAGKDMADALREWHALYTDDVEDIAAEGMRASARKLSRFKKPHGSFSFLRDYSSEISQGAPVALYHSEEGDVNATLIAVSGTIEFCMKTLGLSKNHVPIFGRPHFETFMEIISGNKNS